jgi:exodeoxyribonuclease V alpha subunit
MASAPSLAKGMTDLDRHFADFLTQLEGAHSPELWIAAALVSHFTQQGHVCLDLSEVAGRPLDVGAAVHGGPCPELEHWVRTLKNSLMVGEPGQFRPLILDGSNRLYLHRYWGYEKLLEDYLTKKTSQSPEDVDMEILRRGLSGLFPRSEAQPDWQKVAALISIFRKFAVITGGPGTGKTSTVVKILVLLLEQAGDRKLNLALAAPTGKAAARLKETVKLAKTTLDCPKDLLSRISEDASTLHRLLGTIPNSSKFRHHRGNPLPYDVVVVDEASMVDLPLMAKLVDALRDEARLILLGDRDQLASVEPGAVFGDICSARTDNSFSPDICRLTRSALEEEATSLVESSPAEGLHNSIVVLEKSYRFGSESGIGALSRMINRGEAEEALQLLQEGRHQDLTFCELTSNTVLEDLLEAQVLEDCSVCLKENDIDRAFAAFSRFRILCALREGGTGVETVNQLLEKLLTRRGLIRWRGPWYRGRPILITKNDYHLKVFNGDVGMGFTDKTTARAESSSLWVFVPAEGGLFRKIPPTRLPEHETAYAMTVHKSQGSEFDRVLLILPTYFSEVLTRELVYTGITRARDHLEIWGNGEVLKWAIHRRIERNSGLREALWPGKRL